MTSNIRRAVVDEAGTIASLLQETALWILSKGIRQWNPEMFTTEYVEKLFAEREIYVAESDGEIIGLFTLQWSDPSYWRELDNEESGYLHRLVVRRSAGGSGLGRRMLDWAEDYIRLQGKRWIRLDCMAENTKLNEFYQSCGFTRMGITHFPDRSSILYEKQL